jgi:hypothetical protein
LRKTKLTAFKFSRYNVVTGNLRIALTFKADGPKSIIVEDLQLFWSYEQSPLKFEFTLEDLESLRHEPKSSFAITTGKPVILDCEFAIPAEEKDRPSKTSKLELQAKLENNIKRKKLCQFSQIDCEEVNQTPARVFV